MEQGQPGRPPLGDTLQATRHFLTDAVVFDDYTMHEGMVIPSGTIRTRYHPETCPELPSSSPACPGAIPLPRWPLSAPMGCWVMLRWPRPSVTGRIATHRGILSWIWAHAETVALCLLLTYGLQTGDDATLQHGLRAVHLPQPPHAEGGHG